MGSSPLSIRFDDAVLERLRRRAIARDATPSGLAQRLVDEGLRQQEFPGIVFRDGPSGRRAGLTGGPDVWEVVSAVHGAGSRGAAALTEAARDLDLSDARVRTAIAYYGAHPDEIDAEITENKLAADDALRAWRAQQQLLS